MNTSGYSISAQEYLLAMLHVKPYLDVKLHYVCSPLTRGISQKRQELFNKLERKAGCDPRIYLFHETPSRWTTPKGRKVGFAIFETIEPPPEWIAKMNKMDTVITATEFNKNTFIVAGVKTPIEVVPHCFDPAMFHRGVQPAGRYRNLTFFALGTWRNRKNWSGLVKGWYEAFDRNDHVALLIKTDQPALLQKLVRQIKTEGDWRGKETAPIYSEEHSQCNFEDIPSIMRRGDVYVSASLGEGFGLGGMHAMALGMPVITTRYGGCLEYAKPEFCTYFEPKQYKRIAVMDAIPQFHNKIWPVLPTKEVASKLRYIFEHMKEAQGKSEQAYKYVHENYTYDVIGKRLLRILDL
jgi:glycosyltransferase involved in cell wall biosynthesis